MCSQFFKAWRELFRSTTDGQRAEAFGNVVPQVETLEQAFMECSKGKAFFGGDAIGLADIALGSFLVWIQVVDEVSGTKLLDGARFVPGFGGVGGAVLVRRRRQGRHAGIREALGALQGVSG